MEKCIECASSMRVTWFFLTFFLFFVIAIIVTSWIIIWTAQKKKKKKTTNWMHCTACQPWVAQINHTIIEGNHKGIFTYYFMYLMLYNATRLLAAAENSTYSTYLLFIVHPFRVWRLNFIKFLFDQFVFGYFIFFISSISFWLTRQVQTWRQW